ncbi:MAG: RNA-binding S4 domain-containing protein [Verrucomicrobiae bacterium]|nr:RNA-binding S4 domain-containing protein [Verrucomicrobiae bacterium]
METRAPRMDKWLWAVRLYKTRGLAATACLAGHVKVEGQRVKPARPVRSGEVVEARVGVVTRTVRVLEPLDRRVGPKVVGRFIEDLTPAAEYEKQREPRLEPVFHRPKGTGRPTKKDRRLLDSIQA